MGTEDTVNEVVDVVDGKEAAEETALDEQDQTQTKGQSGDSESGEGEGETSVVETVVDTVVDEIAIGANVAAGFDPEINNIVNEAIAKV